MHVRNGILQNDIKTPLMGEEKYGGGWLERQGPPTPKRANNIIPCPE